jgi:Integral membrane protein CcmA involved in cell shape determination
MFSNAKSVNIQANKIDTVVGQFSNITGNINTTGVVRIDGIYTGDITTESDVIIGESAIVKGNIYALNISISGSLEGNLICQDTLEILPMGKLLGDAELNNFSVSKGAVFNGKCTMLLKENKSLKLLAE